MESARRAPGLPRSSLPLQSSQRQHANSVSQARQSITPLIFHTGTLCLRVSSADPSCSPPRKNGSGFSSHLRDASPSVFPQAYIGFPYARIRTVSRLSGSPASFNAFFTNANVYQRQRNVGTSCTNARFSSAPASASSKPAIKTSNTTNTGVGPSRGVPSVRSAEVKHARKGGR